MTSLPFRIVLDEDQPEMTITFTIDGEAEAEVTSWHYWVVVPEDWSKNYPLCIQGPNQDLSAWGRRWSPVGITTVPADVTCPDCLEWMHA